MVEDEVYRPQKGIEVVWIALGVYNWHRISSKALITIDEHQRFFPDVGVEMKET